MDSVRILLTTYNGSKYIGEMIDSIISQDYAAWELILSDDQSRDGTEKLLEEYAKKYPDKITHYRSGMRFGNAQNHFMHLLRKFRDAPYIMFCDQDDIWHRDKITRTLDKMRETEPPGLPTLIHTNLRVVDADRQLMDGSFMEYARLNGGDTSLKRLLVRNVVTGCTMMINRALADIVSDKPENSAMRMHDWWLALVAASCGKMGYLEQPTIDYRIHGSNAVGSQNAAELKTLAARALRSDLHARIAAGFSQAQALLDDYGDLMSERNRRTVETYAGLARSGWLKRRIVYIRDGYLMDGTAKRLGQMIWG